MEARRFDIEDIFKRYKDRISRLAISIARNERDAEDIIQNTFLKILKNLKNFRNESRLSTWIYKIAYNESLIYLRKSKKERALSKGLSGERGLFINWSKLPDEELLDDEFKGRLNTAIRNIPIKYRMPLLLNSIEGLSLRDTARILGLKLNSVKTRLHRARLILKPYISDYFKDKEAEEMKRDKKCSTLLGFIHDYAVGRLAEDRRDAFKRHIEDCRSCNLFLDTYTKAIQMTNALECQDPPPELQARIEEFLFNKIY